MLAALLATSPPRQIVDQCPAIRFQKNAVENHRQHSSRSSAVRVAGVKQWQYAFVHMFHLARLSACRYRSSSDARFNTNPYEVQCLGYVYDLRTSHQNVQEEVKYWLHTFFPPFAILRSFAHLTSRDYCFLYRCPLV